MTKRAAPNRNLPKILFIFSSAIILFIGGGLAALNDLHPFPFFKKSFAELNSLIEQESQVRSKLLRPSRFSEEGVLSAKPSEYYEGLTIMQGIFPGGPQVRVIDMDGTLVHKWDVDFFKIWPDPSHIFPTHNVPITEFDYHTQGMVAETDGSIVVSLGNLGAAKLDWCSNVIWASSEMTHHSVTTGGQDTYWVAGNRRLDQVSDNLFFPRTSRSQFIQQSLGRYENMLFLLDDKGETVKSFSVLEALVNAGFEHQIYDTILIEANDPTHINDIEIVTSELAEKIDGVNSKDLLVSIRQMHMLAIFDRNTGEIKWHKQGPWVRQHDPDIHPDGSISVFNNRVSGYWFDQYPGSDITRLDPTSHTTTKLFPNKEGQYFYTDIMGSHQFLPNGNLLIAESRSGRVIEVDPEGNTVWEYIDKYDDKYASLIEIVERVPLNFFSTDKQECN